MTNRSALLHSRLAACLAAAGFLFAAPALAQTQLPPPSQYSSADARQDRIEELQQQLTEQTAENERLQYELNQRDREIQRLRSMVGELAGVNQSLSTPPQQPAAGQNPTPAGAQPPRGASAEVAPPTLNSAQRAATGTLGSMSADAVPLPPPAPIDAATQYAQARDLLVNGRYSEAEAAFSDFLEAHPRDTNAADARFWIAFTQLARNNYTDAAGNFVSYLQANPNAPRAPEAQVRLGMALIGMGQQRQGCGAFANLPRRYPNAARNVRDLATREARAAQCAA